MTLPCLSEVETLNCSLNAVVKYVTSSLRAHKRENFSSPRQAPLSCKHLRNLTYDVMQPAFYRCVIIGHYGNCKLNTIERIEKPITQYCRSLSSNAGSLIFQSYKNALLSAFYTYNSAFPNFLNCDHLQWSRVYLWPLVSHQFGGRERCNILH